MSFLIIPIWRLGQINVKFAKDSLFSERYGMVPTFAVLGIRFTWRRAVRASHPPADPIAPLGTGGGSPSSSNEGGA